MPFVQLILGEEIIEQLEPETARELAWGLLQTTEAAEQDAFIFNWVVEKVGSGPVQAAGLIADFRRYRMEKTGKKGGPYRKTDWVYPGKADEPA